jgi:hypothetical protein
MTSFDGCLFATRHAFGNTTAPLDLYCREASKVDLIWTKIGQAPAGTYALAAYYGRLFALVGEGTGNPTLYWRSTRADPAFPYRPPSLLFLNGSSYAVGRLASNGDFETTGSGTLSFSYTHATRANDGLVFFYNAADRSGVVARIAADGTFTTILTYPASSFGAWTSIVYIRCGGRDWADLTDPKEKVIFYNSAGTQVYIGWFDPNTGVFNTDSAPTGFATGWTDIKCTHKGEVFFYNSITGEFGAGEIDDDGIWYGSIAGGGLPTGHDVIPVGHTYLVFYDYSGSGQVKELWNGTFADVYAADGFGTYRRTASSSNGLMMTYDASTGDAEVFGFNGAQAVSMRSYAAAFATNWQYIIPLGIL